MNAVGRASVTIAANAGTVWAALLSAEATRASMFGTTVRSDWVKGVSIELSAAGPQALVSLAQHGNTTEEARERSTKNWATMLESLKAYVEQDALRSQQQSRNSE